VSSNKEGESTLNYILILISCLSDKFATQESQI